MSRIPFSFTSDPISSLFFTISIPSKVLGKPNFSIIGLVDVPDPII